MPKRQLKNAAADALHVIEDSTLDAYHTIEDHDAGELRQDVRGLLDRLAQRLRADGQRFWSWYRARPIPLQIAYGLTLLPLLVLLTLAGMLLVQFGAPLLLGLALLLKLAITLAKTTLFVGYIGYKILKTILMWYYTISRMYLGSKAKRQRLSTARCDGFPVQPPAPLRFRCQGKNLYIEHPDGGQVRVLFSYLRYALRGQWVLLQHLRRSWARYLTLWRQDQRDAIKAELAPVGASMFTPHTLGADVNPERILVPGDAELLGVTPDTGNLLQLRFRVRWVDWHFHWRKSLKFLRIERQVQTTEWLVDGVLAQSATG